MIVPRPTIEPRRGEMMYQQVQKVPIGKSSKNIKIRIFPLKVKNTGIVRIYILTMVPLLWPIFPLKSLLKPAGMECPW